MAPLASVAGPTGMGGTHAVATSQTAGLMEGYDASTYGQRWAGVYDAWYGDEDAEATIVAFLARLASEGPGPIVELGVGTGLLALPLAAMGLDVRGIDASPAMIERLRAKPGGDALPVTMGDMADVVVPVADGRTDQPASVEGSCRGVFVAANTFFGLATEADQRRCVERVRSLLTADGWFVVAAFVPDREQLRGTGSTVGVRSMTADQVVLTADRYDEEHQTISGQYIEIAAEGVVLRPFHIRYLYPDQLDDLTAAAGLRLDRRHGSWDGAPFDEHATMHVSVYRRA